jgi:LacI family transcriptional regulator
MRSGIAGGLTAARRWVKRFTVASDPNLPPPRRLEHARILEVARAAGVSIATVSNVLNRRKYVSPPLKARVERAAQRLHYRPDGLAAGLRRRRTRTIGLLVSDVTNPFFTDLARAVEDHAAAAGYHVVLGNTDEDVDKQRAYVEVFLSLRVAGLVVAPAGGRPAGLDVPRRRGVPMVFVNRRIPGLASPVVTCDNAAGAARATRHLVAHGHRRIGVLRPDWVTSTIDDRLTGYSRALAAAGLPYHRELVAEGRADRAEAARVAGALLARERPTALLVLSSVMVEGALEALRTFRLRCPRDVALVAYNDPRLAEFVNPPLTCVAQPTRAMGAAAVGHLLHLIGQEADRAALQPIDPRLVLRESCGCPPNPESKEDAL